MSGSAENSDVRWKQRFHHFRKAFGHLSKAVNLAGQRKLSELEQQGIVKAFEITHELAWNTLKDYLEDQGETTIRGAKDATRRAFRFELVEDGDTWMDMIESRNRSVHIYDEAMATKITGLVIKNYFPAFEKFEGLFITFEQDSD